MGEQVPGQFPAVDSILALNLGYIFHGLIPVCNIEVAVQNHQAVTHGFNNVAVKLLAVSQGFLHPFTSGNFLLEPVDYLGQLPGTQGNIQGQFIGVLSDIFLGPAPGNNTRHPVVKADTQKKEPQGIAHRAFQKILVLGNHLENRIICKIN